MLVNYYMCNAKALGECRLHQDKSSPYLELISRVQILTLDTDDFCKFNGEFFVQRGICVKMFVKIQSFFSSYVSQTMEK